MWENFLFYNEKRELNRDHFDSNSYQDRINLFPRAVSVGWKKSKEKIRTLNGRRTKCHKIGRNRNELRGWSAHKTALMTV